ncbi:tRNA-intron lyase [archaeon]|jgi:tRNA-intron endonuclease, archaea type|nr:tRNA-intron lyase [archaeon]
MKIKATLISERITSNSVEAQNLHASQKFGEKLDNKILYSLPEALFLVQNKKMEIFNHQNKKLTQKEILNKFQRIDKKFKTKYLVFKDLRKKGYIVKTALKFGADFRVYNKGSSEKHSKWICFTTSENQKMTWQDFSAKNRVAHSTKKNLLIAIADEEGDVSYYEVKWTRP